MLLAQKIEEKLVLLLVLAVLRMDIGEMVDDDRQLQAPHQFGVRLQEIGVEVQIDHPAERLDLRHHVIEPLQVEDCRRCARRN